ncbi:MAG: AI-2E family transporter, partial [Planctomycetota bacterium]
MDGLVRKRSLRLALLALIVLASFAGIFVLRDIFTPLILGFLIAYVLDPFADGLEACRLPRLAAVVIIFLIFTSVLVVGVTVGGIYTARGIEVAVMRTIGETKLKEFPENAPPEPGVHFEDDAPKNGEFDPGYFVRFKEELADFKRDILPDYLAAGIDEYLATKKEEIQQADRKEQVVERLRAMEEWVEAQLSFTFSDDGDRPVRTDEAADQADSAEDSGLGLFTFISYTVFLPIYVFFFLLEIDTIIATIRRHLPSEHRETVVPSNRGDDRVDLEQEKEDVDRQKDRVRDEREEPEAGIFR